MEQSEIGLATLLDRIREMDREGDFRSLPSQHDPSCLQPYLLCLDRVQHELARHRLLEEEYRKLEQCLQKQQTQTRRRISVEQQLKLYTEALKAQVEELEREKLELLENSKAYIKSLKSSNEQLYLELSRAKASKPNSPSKPTKSHSHHKPRHDRSIGDIVKTEYIERNHSNSAHHSKHPKGRKPAHSTLEDLQENSNTYYLRGQSGKKEGQPSRKKNNKYLFSNYTLLNYLEGSNRRGKREGKGKGGSPPRKGRKEKKANKSTFVPSLEPSSSKKQTI